MSLISFPAKILGVLLLLVLIFVAGFLLFMSLFTARRNRKAGFGTGAGKHAAQDGQAGEETE